MESDGENLENIFEEYEDSENARETERAENVQGTEESSGVKIPVPKRIIKNPRLKFNAERLCGERGIPVLVEHFKNVKFKGVGHEEEDLDKLLTKLEHWTHRLFPSMKFEDCLHQIEKLGKKRPVQTCLRKMRLNMPIQSSDFVNENEDDVHRVEDSEPVEEIDAFDRLVGDSQDVLNPDYSAVENFSDLNSMHSSPVQISYGVGQVLGSATTSGSSLTEEQKERMERNRMLAAERRKARLVALQQNSSDVQSINKEAILSQDIFTQNKSLDSSFRIQENIPSSSCGSLSVVESPSKVNNQNSENLGLDDLIDLVDEEESVSDKNTVMLLRTEHKTPSNVKDKSEEFSLDDLAQVNSIHSEQNVNGGIPNNTNSERTLSDESSSVLEGPKVNNQNSENLVLDDLMDLVDEEESVSDKDTLVLSHKEHKTPGSDKNESEEFSLDDVAQVNAIHSERNVDDGIPNNTNSERTITDESLSVLEGPKVNNQNSENLGLDDLMDLVDEEESVSDKDTLVLSHKEHKTPSRVKDKSEEFSLDDVAQVNSIHSEQNVNGDIPDNMNSEMTVSDESSSVVEGSKVNNQISENLGLNNLIDLVDEEESVSDKNTVVLLHKEHKTPSSVKDKSEEFSLDDVTQVNSIHSEQNVNGDIPDNMNSEMIVSDEISKTENEENLEIESLLDLVNENSGDVQLNTGPNHTKQNTYVGDTEKENVLMDFE